MFKYIVRRLIQAIPTLFGITIISFILMDAAPGGPESLVVNDPKLSPAQRRIIAERFGAFDPLPIKYLTWLIGNDWRMFDRDGDGEPETPGNKYGILRGDFGNSLITPSRSTLSLIGERVLPTLELGIASLTIGLFGGVTIGILAAVWRGGLFDNFTRVMAVLFNAIPIFWLGLLLLLTLSFGQPFKIFPSGNRCPTSLTGVCPPIYERIDHMILPTFVLAVGGIAGFSRFMRASLLEVANQDYIRTARSKGLNDRTVWFKHAARNALIPIATFLGPALTGLLGGAVITEQIFSWPGMGQLGIQAVFRQDFPVVMALTVIGSIATILGFILSDILYALIDPRIRFS